MKRQGRQAESYCKAPDPDSAAVLLFGKPGAPVDEFADTLITKLLKASKEPLDRKRLTPEDAKQEPGQVVDELFSASLFGGASLIITNIQKESEAAPFLAALQEIEARGELPAGRLVILAGDLGPRSKLRKSFEGAKRASALQFFERSAYEFEGWVKDYLSEHKIPLESDAREILIQTLLEDQKLAESELLKLALYVADREKPLSKSEVSDLIALEDQSSQFELVDLALDGKSAALARLLPQISMENAAIPLLIGLSNQLKRLSQAHQISASGTQGAKIGEKLFPRIYERQWPAFDKRMRIWNPSVILSLLARISETDMACRRAGSPQDAMVGQLFLDIAELASGSRR